jgi:hypothetical protein
VRIWHRGLSHADPARRAAGHAGGPAPLIATALLASTGSGYSVAIYILVCAIISISATIFLPDYTNQDISQEEAYRAPEASRVLAEAPAGS